MSDLTFNQSGNPSAIVDPVNNTALIVGSDGSIRVSLGNTDSKTLVLKTGTLVTTATTIDQVVLTYTVTAGKTFFLEYVQMVGAQTVPAGGTSIVAGIISLELPSGTKVINKRVLAGGGILPDALDTIPAEPLFISAGTIVRVVVTPASTTSFTWTANFGGYEK